MVDATKSFVSTTGQQMVSASSYGVDEFEVFGHATVCGPDVDTFGSQTFLAIGSDWELSHLVMGSPYMFVNIGFQNRVR